MASHQSLSYSLILKAQVLEKSDSDFELTKEVCPRKVRYFFSP